MKYIEQADQFGVSFSPYISGDGQKSQYRSFIGGITSVCIYSLAFAYFIYQMVQWGQGKLLPTSAGQTQLMGSLTYDFSDLQIVVSTMNPLNPPGSPGPFDVNSMILIPSIFTPNVSAKPDVINSTTVIFKNVSLSMMSTLTFMFTNCSDKDINFICADKDKNNPNITNNFYTNLNQISINIQQQQYDVTRQELVWYQKQFYVTLDPTLTQFQTLEFRTGKTSVESGFLFANEVQYNYLYSTLSTVQSISQMFANFIVKQQAVWLIELKLDNIQFQSTIQYPMLSTVMANVGSIVSLLMMSQILIRVLNSILLKQYLVKEIIEYYYPEFKTIQIKRNFFNKLQVTSNNEKIQYEHEELEKIYQNAEKIALKKLGINNIIYELSRIQFILQSLQDRDLILQSKNIGIKLPLKVINNDQKVRVFNEMQEQSKKLVEQSQITEKNHQLQTPKDQIEDKLKSDQRQMQSEDSQSKLLNSDMELLVCPSTNEDKKEIPNKEQIQNFQFYQANLLLDSKQVNLKENYK